MTAWRSSTYVVLTHPEPNANGELVVAVVNVSTVRGRRCDQTVVLKKSDYIGFADPPYYVAYGFANFEKVDDINRKRGYAAATTPFTSKVFQRIFEGVLKLNGNAPPTVREYCSERVGVIPGHVRNLWKERNPGQ